jgi:hypothetical protein
MMKPLSTGSEMKLARKPRRSSPATRAMSPVVMARAAVWATNPALLGMATSATAAADRAAVADIGPTTRCRELPKAAYSSSAPGAAYSPTTGDTPAIEAYARASGTSTAHTVSPATTSPRSQPVSYPPSEVNRGSFTRPPSPRVGGPVITLSG